MPKPILLASKSPRRKQLLEAAGFSYQTIALDVPEDYPSSLSPEEVAPYLAKKKGDGANAFLEEGKVLLTADSVVILNGSVYEKPATYEEAYRMLSDLSGNVHEVITGVCLKTPFREKVFAGHSLVYFSQLSHEEKDYYINNYHPFDKAGSYGIQDWIGLCKVSKIEGSYSNIMGLPMELVYREMQDI